MKNSGKENEMMPRNVFWAPITASRFFSSDFTDEELIDKLSHVSDKNDDNNNGLHHALTCFSGSDEHAPKHMNANTMIDRSCNAMNYYCKDSKDIAIPLMLENANHNLSQEENDSETFVKSIGKCLPSISSKK